MDQTSASYYVIYEYYVKYYVISENIQWMVKLFCYYFFIWLYSVDVDLKFSKKFGAIKFQPFDQSGKLILKNTI